MLDIRGRNPFATRCIYVRFSQLELAHYCKHVWLLLSFVVIFVAVLITVSVY